MPNTIDITQLYEGNCYEAKFEKSGLPNSIWETYSAFANTDGEFILLGVKENKDHSFTAEGVEINQILSDKIDYQAVN